MEYKKQSFYQEDAAAAIVKKWLLQNSRFAPATFESCGSDDQEGAGGGGELNRAGGAARAKD